MSDKMRPLQMFEKTTTQTENVESEIRGKTFSRKMVCMVVGAFVLVISAVLLWNNKTLGTRSAELCRGKAASFLVEKADLATRQTRLVRRKIKKFKLLAGVDYSA